MDKESYDLFHHTKVPLLKRGMQSTSNKGSFHGRFSVISVFRNPFKMKICNCSHRHHSEPIVCKGSMLKVVFPVNCFILFHCGIVHCGTLSWFINKAEYHINTRAFFTIVKKSLKLDNEITVQLEDKVCSIETCDICFNNKYATIEDSGSLINFRSIKKSHATIDGEKKISITLLMKILIYWDCCIIELEERYTN